MGHEAIIVEDIGKRYRIGAQEEAYRTLREGITDAVKTPLRAAKNRFRRFSGSHEGTAEKSLFWALRNISFELEQGRVLGVIGRNGAGKSTLLKVLCRVTEPTEGRARLRGRVGSLLEVATGFHPELSGRENIYLNGAILGMTKKEIERKFDEIVGFAETERFLDTQVKHYSSGMYMRLAFAVAAHLEPQILLIDEVLAVGDAAFQKKCLGRMSTIAKGGRTILFVSHNMGAVNSLCDEAIWIDHGNIVKAGRSTEVVEAYMIGQKEAEAGDARVGYSVDPRVLEQGIDGFRVTDCRVRNDRAPQIGASTGDPLTIEIDYEATKDFMSPAFSVRIRDLYGFEIARFNTMPFGGFEIDSLYEAGTVTLRIDELPLVSGHYLIDIHFERPNLSTLAKLDSVAEFDVEAKDYYGSGMLRNRTTGLILLKHKWRHEAVDHPRC